MDGQVEVIETILRWVWAPMGVTLVWTIKKLFGLEKDMTERRAGINTKLAVFEANQNALKKNVEDFTERNEKAHERLEEKMDKHNESVMKRFDNLTGLIRNGNK